MACYCTQCGKEMDPNAAICVNCGFAKGTGKNYCGNCGNPVDPNAAVCVKCGVALANTNNVTVPGLGGTSEKSKMAAGLFAIFLGHLGIHHFYLGNNNKAILCIVLTVVAALTTFLFGIGFLAFIGLWIWHIIEGVKILTDKNATDVDGKLLK